MKSKTRVFFVTLIVLGALALVMSVAVAQDKGDAKKDKAAKEKAAEEGDDYYEQEQAGGMNYEEQAPVELGKEDILPVIKKRYTSIRACYETVLQTNQSLSGKLIVQFDIKADGTTTNVKNANESTMKDKKVVECVLQIFETLRFTERKGGELQPVRFPLNFQPKEK